MDKVNLRLANKQDLGILEDIRNEQLPKLHLLRIKKQEEKKGEYFIAFRRRLPVGHVFINYKNSLYEYPLLEDLFVKEKFRNQSIANKILIFVEDHIKRKGFKDVGLDVEISKTWLKELYEKRGYVKVSGPFTWTYIHKDKGNKKTTKELYHLKKQLYGFVLGQNKL